MYKIIQYKDKKFNTDVYTLFYEVLNYDGTLDYIKTRPVADFYDKKEGEALAKLLNHLRYNYDKEN